MKRVAILSLIATAIPAGVHAEHIAQTPVAQAVAQLAQDTVAQAAQPEQRQQQRPQQQATDGDAAPEQQPRRSDLPMSREVTSGQQLQQSQDGYADVARRQSGVTAQASVGNAAANFAIRGIALNPNSNYRLDGGLPVTAVQSMPTEDKARLETLKGANALMFGIASPAGIINLIPKRASPNGDASFTLSGNSFGQIAGHADIGTRFGEQKQAGIRVNLSKIRVENGVRDTDGKGDFASIGFDWRASQALMLQGDVEYYTRDVPEQPRIAIPAAVGGVIPSVRVPDPRNNLLGPGGDWAVYRPRSLNYQLRADYEFTPNWKTLVQAGVSQTSRDRHAIRISGYTVATGANGQVVDTNTANEGKNTFGRAELIGTFATGPVRHNATVGVSYTERATSGEQIIVTLTQRQNIFTPIAIPRPAFGARTPLRDQTSTEKGVYAYDTAEILPSLKVLGGVRLTRDTESIAGRPDTSSDTTSPAIGLLYDIRPTTTIYASYMSGLEAGTVAPTGAANVSFVLAPAVSKQKEIGIRDTSFAGMNLNLAYFQIERANAIVDPVTNIYGYNGNLHYKGVEGSVSYAFLRDWTVTGSFQNLKAVQNSPLQPLVNGKAPENTPRWSGNLFVNYRAPWLRGLQLNAGATTVSNRFVNSQEQGTIPGYSLFTVGAGYQTQIMGKRTAFQVSVENVGNKRYWNSIQTGQYGIGMDRSVRFSARVDL